MATPDRQVAGLGDQRSLKWVYEEPSGQGGVLIGMLCGGLQLDDLGDEVTSSRNGKGLGSGAPSSSPGVGY